MEGVASPGKSNFSLLMSPHVLLAIPGILVALLIGYSCLNLAYNNHYNNGGVLWDSVEFATNIWRSGWTLDMGPLYDRPYMAFHIAPILYIPNLVSYVFPGDRITYYGLVYAFVYAALMFTAFRVLVKLLPEGWKGSLLAAFGTLMLFVSQPIYNGSWELRADYASPLFMLLGFRAWQLHRPGWTLLWFMLNAFIHEAMAFFYVTPFVLLGVSQYWALRKTDITAAQSLFRQVVIITLVPLTYSLAAIVFQHTFFDAFDTIGNFYFPAGKPFDHLSADVLERRLNFIFVKKMGLWVPLLALTALAALYRDRDLLIGAVAFLPYLLVMFLSQYDGFGNLAGYRSFPLVLAFIWPALLALGKPDARRRMLVVQAVVLCCAMTYLRPGHLDFSLTYRWVAQPMTDNAQAYLEFGEKHLDNERPFHTRLRASQGILALYPYQFPVQGQSWVRRMHASDVQRLETLIWFEGDLDADYVRHVLQNGNYDVTSITGTKIRIARRVMPGFLRQPSMRY